MTSEIAQAVASSNTVVNAEGMTNRERVSFICAVFEADAISLNEDFDYDAVLQTEDPALIYAALQLASLQFEYATRLHLEKAISEQHYEQALESLETSRTKLRWAFAFRRFDLDPPPHPFAH